jgi:crotonobetainyl-CoA:carnitine CoA-transferase CaiB-like acyl-CoA transferase
VAIGFSPLEAVADALDIPDLIKYGSESERYEYRDELHDMIEDQTKEMPVEEIVDVLSAADVQASPVNEVTEIESDPQIKHNDMILELEHSQAGAFKTTGFPVEMSETPGKIRHQPPELGQHTDDILAECGYSVEEIESFRESDIVN